MKSSIRRIVSLASTAAVAACGVVLAGCAGTGGGRTTVEPRAMVAVVTVRAVDDAAVEPQVLVETRILSLRDTAPAGALASLGAADGVSAWTADPAAVAEMVRSGDAVVVTAPTLIAMAGERATIFVGDTIRFDTARLTATPNADGTVTYADAPGGPITTAADTPGRVDVGITVGLVAHRTPSGGWNLDVDFRQQGAAGPLWAAARTVSVADGATVAMRADRVGR